MHISSKIRLHNLPALTPAFSLVRWRDSSDANGYAYALDCPDLGDRAVSGFLCDVSAVTCNRNNERFETASRHIANLARDGWLKVESPDDVAPDRPVIAALGDCGIAQIWLRRDLSGLWSYKTRNSGPKARDDKMDLITNPQCVTIGYGRMEMLGYYAMPENGINVAQLLMKPKPGSHLKLVKG